MFKQKHAFSTKACIHYVIIQEYNFMQFKLGMTMGTLNSSMSRSFWGLCVPFSELTGKLESYGRVNSQTYDACTWVLLTLNMSRSFSVIWCTFLKIGHNLEMTHHRATWTKIQAASAYLVCTWVVLTLNRFQFIRLIQSSVF